MHEITAAINSRLLRTIEYKLVSPTEWISDLNKEGTSFSREGLSRRPATAWKKQIVVSTSPTNGAHYILKRNGPVLNGGEVVRLVHKTENHTFVIAIFLGQLSPQA